MDALLPIEHFSDVLCVWAYCAQIRLDELLSTFAGRVAVRYRFVAVFGSTAKKIGEGWAARGGFEGYAAHARGVAARFPHVTMHEDAWTRVRPASSSSPHAFLAAVRLVEGAGPSGADGPTRRAAWALREAFFRDARDVGLRAEQLAIAEALGLPRAELERLLDDGRALAGLAEDAEAQAAQKIEGSPTLVFDQGRQKLYGNVGYRVIQANVEELLRAPDPGSGSWC